MSWLKTTFPPTNNCPPHKICSHTYTCPHTNRSQLTTILPYVLLVLLGVTVVSSAETNPEVKAQGYLSSERCLVDEPVPERKFLTHNSKKKDITLLGSQRIASRC